MPTGLNFFCKCIYAHFSYYSGISIINRYITFHNASYVLSCVSTEADNLAFIFGNFKIVLCQTFPQVYEEIPRFCLVLEHAYEVSSPKELPLEALSEPCVNLSAHTAPIMQPKAIFQISSVQTFCRPVLLLFQASAQLSAFPSHSCWIIPSTCCCR